MTPTRVFPRWGQIFALIQIASLLLLAAPPLDAQSDPDRPAWGEVEQLVATQLAERKEYRPGDLITFSDVKGVLTVLAASGWRPDDHQEILEDTLADSDALVRILSSEQGTRFMRKVSQDHLIYDRMDRVSRVWGGQRMLRDITRLPDGEKLAKLHRPHGTPGFLDLLPKKASGKVRTIRDYDKPTERIYTQKQLMQRLQQSYRGNSDQLVGAGNSVPQ